MIIDNRLAVVLPGLTMKNPIMNSSGAVYFGLDDCYDIEKSGALVTKTVTLAARSGNPQPWTVETRSGLLNSVGLANPGIQSVLTDFLPAIKAKYGDDLPVMVSIAGETIDEYVTLARLLTDSNYLTAIEVNLSCPNVDRGGMVFGVSAEAAAEVVGAISQVTNLPIYAKLSPNVTDIKPIAKAVEAAGASGIVLINTVTGMSFDLQKRQPKLARGIGGLSGKAIHPIAVRLVYEAKQTVSIPIIGVGGIETVDDAIELMMAGASAVQVGAALTYNTHMMSDIIKVMPSALDDYCFDTCQTLTHMFK